MTISEMIAKRTGQLPPDATPVPDIILIYKHRQPGSTPPLCGLTPPVVFCCTPPDKEQIDKATQNLRDQITRRVIAPGQKLDVCQLCHQNIADVHGNILVSH